MSENVKKVLGKLEKAGDCIRIQNGELELNDLSIMTTETGVEYKEYQTKDGITGDVVFPYETYASKS